MFKKILSGILSSLVLFIPNCMNLNVNAENITKVDLSEKYYFPPIIQQKGNSCSSVATTYYQFTYEVNKKYRNNSKLSYEQFIENTTLVDEMFIAYCNEYDATAKQARTYITILKKCPNLYSIGIKHF